MLRNLSLLFFFATFLLHPVTLTSLATTCLIRVPCYQPDCSHISIFNLHLFFSLSLFSFLLLLSSLFNSYTIDRTFLSLTFTLSRIKLFSSGKSKNDHFYFIWMNVLTKILSLSLSVCVRATLTESLVRVLFSSFFSLFPAACLVLA